MQIKAILAGMLLALFAVGAHSATAHAAPVNTPGNTAVNTNNNAANINPLFINDMFFICVIRVICG